MLVGVPSRSRLLARPVSRQRRAATHRSDNTLLPSLGKWRANTRHTCPHHTHCSVFAPHTVRLLLQTSLVPAGVLGDPNCDVWCTGRGEVATAPSFFLFCSNIPNYDLPSLLSTHYILTLPLLPCPHRSLSPSLHDTHERPTAVLCRRLYPRCTLQRALQDTSSMPRVQVDALRRAHERSSLRGGML